MRASLTTTALAAVLVFSACPALAQNADQSAGQNAGQTAGQGAGLRYMTWNGRGSATAVQPVAQPAAQPVTRRDLRRPNPVIPHGGGFASAVPLETASRLTPAPGSSGRLTPADAWRPSRAVAVAGPAPTPVFAQPAAPAPEASQPRPAAPEIAYVAPPPTVVEPPRELAPPGYPDYLPNRGVRQYVPSEIVQPVQPTGQPVYAGQSAPAGTAQADPQPAPATDPMAPRRDAPIFRLQQAAPPVEGQPSAAHAADPNAPHQLRMAAVPSAGQPPQQGARRYSVHRQNGQQPDGVAIPEPTYVDALVMTLGETPASQDLAQPDKGPTLIRDNQGRMRAAPAASDGDHQ